MDDQPPGLNIVDTPLAEDDADPCVVDTAPLSAVVASFVAQWKTTRPSSAGQFARRRRAIDDVVDDVARSEVSPVGAVQYLAAASGVKPATIENVQSCRTRTTEYWIADRLTAALGVPELWRDGTLTVRPNPRAPRHVRALCCSGSLTGAAGG